MFKKIGKVIAEWLAVACLCWLPFAYYFMFILEG